MSALSCFNISISVFSVSMVLIKEVINWWCSARQQDGHMQRSVARRKRYISLFFCTPAHHLYSHLWLFPLQERTSWPLYCSVASLIFSVHIGHVSSIFPQPVLPPARTLCSDTERHFETHHCHFEKVQGSSETRSCGDKRFSN